MLRLIIEPLTAWRDSQGILRSAYSDLGILSDDARQLFERNAQGFIAWQFGVVTDDWEHSDECKEIGNPLSPRYAVGHGYAHEYFSKLVDVWKAFLSWLGVGFPQTSLFVADQIWSAEARWREIGPAIEEGLIPGVNVKLKSTAKAGRYFISGTTPLWERLIERWWPSPLGMIGGARFLSATSTQIMHRVARQGEIVSADLDYIDLVFATTPALDELGFSVISRADDWEEIERSLTKHGWQNDMPVEFLPGYIN